MVYYFFFLLFGLFLEKIYEIQNLKHISKGTEILPNKRKKKSEKG